MILKETIKALKIISASKESNNIDLSDIIFITPFLITPITAFIKSSKNEFKISNISKVLSTRNTARNIFLKLNNEKKDTLDFAGVDIVSRSFANEWLNLEKNHNIKKINMNKEVSFMFRYADKKLDSNVLKNSKYRTISIDELISEA